MIWYLGMELKALGHQVTYLVNEGSTCHFAPVLTLDRSRPLDDQIPNDIDIVHFHYVNPGHVSKPYIITMHVNDSHLGPLDKNTVFISRNQAARFGSQTYVHNGLNWDDYGAPDLLGERKAFHFLGNAAWRVKNVQGAIDIIKLTKREKLNVLGGKRLNIKMGFRLTLSPRVSFHGMVGGEEKNRLLCYSKGLIFPVRWHEPFGLAIIESLYYGSPVFGTPYGSLPELVPAEVGFLSNRKSLIADAIQNNSYAAQACHEYAVEKFNSKKMAEGYVEKYNQILNGNSLNTDAPEFIRTKEKGMLPFHD